jgi:hypothetical protein
MLLSTVRASPFPELQIFHGLVSVTIARTKLVGGKGLAHFGNDAFIPLRLLFQHGDERYAICLPSTQGLLDGRQAKDDGFVDY